MEVFGYVCSALCKGKAETQGTILPVYENLKSAVDARQWRKVSLIAGSITAVVLAVLGCWFWYAWFGSQPRVAFSVRFPEAAYSGQCRLLPQNQEICLHGGTLARHDIKAKREVWSLRLIDKKKIEDDAGAALEQTKRARAQAISNGADGDAWKAPTLPELISGMEREAASALQLHVHRESVWVSFPDKLVRYDWETGKPSQEIPFRGSAQTLVPNGDELLLISRVKSGHQVTHINAGSGESRTEEIAGPASDQVAQADKPSKSRGAAPLLGNKSGPAKSKTLDPAAIANRSQNLPLPAKLALPAVLAANANQERLVTEMRDEPEAEGAVPWSDGFEPTSLRTDENGFVQFSVKLLESKIIERQAMKAPPKKSALEGDVNASSTAAVANEILNEIQRDRGGDVVQEDVSRYQVTLRRPGVKEAVEWAGEVTGRPELFTLQTVDVLAAGKSILVFNKANKKLWETKLNFPLSSGARTSSGDTPAFGEGPAVERGDTLYLFDPGVLSAFELASGNARWRLPAVGVSGLHFDEGGMIYANTSSASPDILKYPNQIDISEKATQLILKVNPRTGAILWKAEREGLVSYVSGKFIYTTVSYRADDDDGAGSVLGMVKTGLEMPSHIRIKRLDPSNGRVLWEHYQKRVPLDVRFEKNTIQLLFRKEMQVLKFFSL